MAVASQSERVRIDHPDDKRMELTEHLAELRSRIMRMIFYAVVGASVCYYRFEQIYAFLFRPMRNALNHTKLDWKIVFPHFMDAFFVVLQISIVAGLIVAAPLIIMELYGFVVPALTREEKRPLRYVIPMSVVLFALGVLLAYWVAPLAIGWFVDYVRLFPNGVLYQDPQKYIMFMLKMMAIFGAVFQLPVALMFLAWVGLLRSAGMKKTWRHAIVGISIVGLVVTPSNDWFTMLVMIIPVILLYLASIWLVQFIERKRERELRKRFG